MAVLSANAYLAVAVPLALAAAIGLAGRWVKPAAPWIALAGPLVVLATGIGYVTGGAREAAGSVTWLRAGTSAFEVGWHMDGLAAVMLIVVGTVASAVVAFSAGYMRGDRGFARYFALVSLFTASMTLLVISSSLVLLFVGWELVGACSYLLIGFWYEKHEAAEAARKAFLVTRVGDVGFLLGLAVLWQQTGTLSIESILGKAGGLPAWAAALAALLLFAGAAGKSAQFPLHVWLPDAMEGPTPVSALIHAATMVAAGVFLVARMWPLFEASPQALAVVLVTGTITALGAATVALAQTDIKKVLAYSTLSQLGFMFAALGAGAWGAAIFHLVTHAAFKALLFLSAGSVIHGSHTQELREMGGLRKSMPLTAACWVAGALALAGIPPLSGFFSKDAVVASVMHMSPLAGVALLTASVVTGLYVGRTTYLAFFGTYRGEGTPHESSAVMTVPLVVLAVLAVAAGLAQGGVERLLALEAEGLDWMIATAAVAAGAVGLATGWGVWRSDPTAEESLPGWLKRVWAAMYSGYGYDALLYRVFVGPSSGAAKKLYESLDRRVVDGAVEGAGRGAVAVGRWMARLQNGDGSFYATLVGMGGLVAAAIAIWLGR